MVPRKRAIFEPSARRLSKRVISFEVKMVDRYVPDKLLLLLVNTLDKRMSPRAITGVVNSLEKLPPRMRSSLITAADTYVPDSVANSRKVSAVVAGIGKYVPDRIIPPESAEEWSNLKTRFFIPTLLSRPKKR